LFTTFLELVEEDGENFSAGVFSRPVLSVLFNR